MGKNQKQSKPKGKSVKAKESIKMGSKRKLSRMGKRRHRGDKGIAANYLTRSQVLKRLQITLRDFRRLCILKGIYPRDPKKKANGKDKTYYHLKDVSYLAHEPLLNKFREFKGFMKKIKRALGRGEVDEARRKDAAKPTYTLDHLVRERYPRFLDAVNDLDDALCLIHLFSALPSEGKITSERTISCQLLMAQWTHWVAQSRSLSKCFVSIKGIYFQALIQGQTVTWLVPHSYTQTLPAEVDFRVMLTFLEFYEVFVRFVLFKLYRSSGLQFPPELTPGSSTMLLRAAPQQTVESAGPAGDANGASAEKSGSAPMLLTESGGVGAAAAELPAGDVRKQQKESLRRAKSLGARLQESGSPEEEDGDMEVPDDEDEGLGAAGSAQLQAALMDRNEDLQDDDDDTPGGSASSDRPPIFRGLRLFLSREAYYSWLEFAIVSFGGAVGWDGDGSPFGTDDPHVTHQVVDRPPKASTASGEATVVARDMVQPQWIIDSINCRRLLPVERYAPGAKLPPHLSPFVDDRREGYLPAYREELNALNAGTSDNAPKIAAGTTTPEEEEEEEDEEEDDGSDDDEEESPRHGGKTDERAKQADKQTNAKASTKAKKQASNTAAAPLSEADEAHDLAKIMMSKKAKRLYDRMQHGLQEKEDKVSELQKRRKQLENK